MVNDWKAAKELDVFVKLFLDPSTERTLEARKILEDPNYKWKKGEKDRAKAKFQKIEGENINLHRFVNAVRGLIDDHEALTDTLTEVYSAWYNNIASDGKQPTEMMSMQAEILQYQFHRIFEALEELKLDLKPPKYEEGKPIADPTADSGSSAESV